MLSVTQRIKTVSQPRGGYLPVKSLEKRYYRDGNTIDTTSQSYRAYSNIQGMAVDYLTRLMCGFPVEKVFRISIAGAKKVNEYEKAMTLLERIKGLDYASIIAACKLTGYDVAFRRGPLFFSSVDNINPDKEIVNNIEIMVKRGIKFLLKQGKVLDVGITFEGGYSKLVSSGDGDFLTSDGLWDFKTSTYEPNSAETLQILMYFAMAVHSKQSIYQNINKIGLFNPLKNILHFIPVDCIKDEIMATVGHDVLGYNYPENMSKWRETEGEDSQVILDYINQKERELTLTDFDPNCFEDGIHDISIDDYGTFCLSFLKRERPKLSYTEKILFLKNSDFLMFISASASGEYYLLHGGHIKKLDKPVRYYYDNMAKYANSVLSIFVPYWEFLEAIGKKLRRIEPNKELLQKGEYEKVNAIRKAGGREIISFDSYVEKFDWDYKSAMSRFEGRVHGCIVDLDYSNHIYVNPYDGTITPYHAESMVSKHVYSNLASLIADKRPEMLPGFENSRKETTTALPPQNGLQEESLELLLSEKIDTTSELVYDTGMYAASRIMRGLQYIYDFNLICDWYDDILYSNSLPEPENN